MGLICFDLDGTLVDPLRAMEHCLRATCEDLGVPGLDRARVAEFVGFGARDLLAAVPGLAAPGRLDAALERYWSHFAAEGIVKHRIYEGVLLMLARLKHQGHRLYVVTVKPARLAREILHQFDLLLSFDDVIGSSPSGARESKGEVMAQLAERGAFQPGGFMVGDRASDMAVARGNGLIPVGVTYGFGGERELREAGAEFLLGSVAELDDWLKARLPGPETLDPFSRSE